MKIIETDLYGNKTERTEIKEEKLQIIASLFKWGIIGGIVIATIISTGFIGVATISVFALVGMLIKEGLE